MLPIIGLGAHGICGGTARDTLLSGNSSSNAGRRRPATTGAAAGAGAASLGVACRFFTRDDIGEEVEYLGFGAGRGDVRTLEGAALVLLGMDPGANRQVGDEDITTLGDIGIELHS